ncbi:hypothetical protein G7Y89_g2727 [Cudoniella acicularis]|uniref:C2H2-type domain-containing protein n=1 Tax=Cudoniella acicularis TaxID=354080 RepID=A0A8H4RTL6_9HELO|nr:hypothetical protein G7Y89_g2727 [Cudoniella acicularis]
MLSAIPEPRLGANVDPNKHAAQDTSSAATHPPLHENMLSATSEPRLGAKVDSALPTTIFPSFQFNPLPLPPKESFTEDPRHNNKGDNTNITSGSAHPPEGTTEEHNQYSFPCYLCTRVFGRREHLRRHFKSIHTKDKPFGCDKCGKKYNRKDNLRQHTIKYCQAVVRHAPEDSEAPGDFDSDNERINSFGSILFNLAAAAPGSDTDSDGEGQSPKEWKPSE